MVILLSFEELITTILYQIVKMYIQMFIKRILVVFPLEFIGVFYYTDFNRALASK